MKRLGFRIELLSDTVVSAVSATTGGHQCLDYIPGSALLGVAAKHLYPRLKSSGHSFSVFHSGLVRFGNAYPDFHQPTAFLPVPFSWHHEKGGARTRMANLAVSQWESKIQRQQLREGWVHPASGSYETLSRFPRMKSAISDRAADFGTSEESQLFAYSSIPGGFTLRGEVLAEDAVADQAWAILDEFFSDRLVHLGRSKTAEFGAANLSRTPVSDLPTTPPGEGRSEVIVYALSDLALLDPHGQPSLSATAESLGLPGVGSLVPTKSFVRTRRYSPWNAQRRGPDLERSVIEKGSVLVFQCGDFTGSGFHLAGGYQNEGLGQLLINPPFLDQATTCVEETRSNVSPHAAEPREEVPFPNLPFALACQSRYIDRQLELVIALLGSQWAKEWMGFKPSPSKSQWARLRSAATRSPNLAALSETVKKIAEEGTGAKKWQKAMKGRKSLGSFVQDKLSQADEMAKTQAFLAENGLDSLAQDALSLLILGACREAAILVSRSIEKK